VYEILPFSGLPVFPSLTSCSDNSKISIHSDLNFDIFES
jgi:hypothetical protein